MKVSKIEWMLSWDPVEEDADTSHVKLGPP
jgi:hypothetical protein